MDKLYAMVKAKKIKMKKSKKLSNERVKHKLSNGNRIERKLVGEIKKLRERKSKGSYQNIQKEVKRKREQQ